MLLLVLSILGSGLLLGSRGATTASQSFYNQARALEAAEGGLEHARQALREALESDTLTELLEDARNGGTLVDSSSLTNFLGSNGWVNGTANAPLLAPTAIDAASYQVFLTNDSADGTTSPVDTNDVVTVTSFGSGPRQIGFVTLQANMKVALSSLKRPAGFLALPGPSVNFSGLSSVTHSMDGEDLSPQGQCIPAIALTSNVAVNQVRADILGPPNRANRYRSCDPHGGPDITGLPTVENVIQNDPLTPSNPYQPSIPNNPYFPPGDPSIMSVPFLNSLVRDVRRHADHTSTSEPGFNLGSPGDPKIVVIDGDLTVSSQGAGILVVSGHLQFNGQIRYNGMILAIGEGRVTVSGAGNGVFTGALLVANTATPWDPQGRYVGIPTYAISGGGIANQQYDFDLATAQEIREELPLDRVAYRRLR